MMHLFDFVPAGAVVRVVLGAAAAALIAMLALRAKALTKSGAAATVAIGAAVYAGAGLPLSAALVAFFVSGSTLGRLGDERADAARKAAAKSGPRDALQVLANGGAAAACALSSLACRALDGPHAADIFYVAGIASIAAAAGDTWASEVGVRARDWPVLITTFARVRPGTSGAVTWLGTAAAIVGGTVVALAAAPFDSGLRPMMLAALGAAAGWTGTMVDSLLGASVQGAWHCDACDAPSDLSRHGCGAAARHVRGLASVGNDAVNGVTTVTVAGLAAVAAALGG